MQFRITRNCFGKISAISHYAKLYLRVSAFFTRCENAPAHPTTITHPPPPPNLEKGAQLIGAVGAAAPKLKRNRRQAEKKRISHLANAHLAKLNAISNNATLYYGEYKCNFALPKYQEGVTPLGHKYQDGGPSGPKYQGGVTPVGPKY